MNDRKFFKHIDSIIKKNKDYLKECFSYYVAFYIYNLYYYDKKLLNYNFRNILNDCLSNFNNLSYDDINIEQIKKFLIKKYKLKIVYDNPVIIEKL